MKTEILLSGNSGNTERERREKKKREREREKEESVSSGNLEFDEGNRRTPEETPNHLYFDLERPTRDPRNRG